jgi:pyruvate dehydrogenase E1 component alpha subunit
MFSVEKAFYGGHGIVGAQVSLGAGIAFANRYRKDGKVCLTYFGDGAANQGQVYESFNMAALWKLPAVFIVENNQYAMGTAIERSTSETHLHKRGISFNIPGEEVDGMDVLAVKDAGLRAVARARAGEGPTLLEMKTYRYRGHSMSDPAKYRAKEEVDDMKAKHDPIDHVKKLIIDAGHADEEALKEIDREIRKVVTDSAEFAQQSPEPDPSELMTDIYLNA